jgi:hypothetical protein
MGLPCPPQDAPSALTQGPLSVTVFPDRILERNFLGFGVEWAYEGDGPENNLNNPVWTNHWPDMVKRVDFDSAHSRSWMPEPSSKACAWTGGSMVRPRLTVGGFGCIRFQRWSTGARFRVFRPPHVILGSTGSEQRHKGGALFGLRWQSLIRPSSLSCQNKTTMFKVCGHHTKAIS